MGLGLIGRLGALALLAGALLAVPVARAQDDPQAEARDLFERAQLELRAGRFAAARDLFAQSLERYPRAPTAFNLGVALRGTGETRASVLVLERLLAGDYGEVDAERREQVESLLRDVVAELAELRVRVRGAPRAELRLDGERVGDVDDGGLFEQRVDAGRHVLTASAPGHRTAERTVELERGGAAEIALRLEAQPDLLSTPPTTDDDGDGRPGLWIALSLTLVALAAGGVALGLVLGGRDANPVRDPVFGIVETLRATR